MDPFTLITGAAALTQTLITVSDSLYNFVQAAKKINETVSELRTEIDTVKTVVASIGRALTEPGRSSSHTPHWAVSYSLVLDESYSSGLVALVRALC